MHDFYERAFAGLLRPSSKMANIVRDVSEETGVPVDAIMSNSRKASIARARQVAFYLGRQAGVTYGGIGRYFGVHHTTVMHGVAKIESLVGNGGYDLPEKE